MSKGLYYGVKRIAQPTYNRRRIRVQKNSDILCGVFNSDRSQFKPGPLHKRKPPLRSTLFNIEINQYHKGT